MLRVNCAPSKRGLFGQLRPLNTGKYICVEQKLIEVGSSNKLDVCGYGLGAVVLFFRGHAVIVSTGGGALR